MMIGIPFLLIVGDREEADATISVRSRRNDDLGTMTLSGLEAYFQPFPEPDQPKCIIDD